MHQRLPTSSLYQNQFFPSSFPLHTYKSQPEEQQTYCKFKEMKHTKEMLLINTLLQNINFKKEQATFIIPLVPICMSSLKLLELIPKITCDITMLVGVVFRKKKALQLRDKMQCGSC